MINKMRRGQAFLSLVILIGAIALVVAATLAFIAASFVDTGYGYQASAQAGAVANSGAEDGLLHLNRGDLSYPASYDLPVASNTAAVTITKDSPSTGYYTILSTATVSFRTRKVSVVAQYNASTSQIVVTSWQNTQ